METKSTKMQAIVRIRNCLGCTLVEAQKIVEDDMYDYNHGCLSSTNTFKFQLDDLTDEARQRYLEWQESCLHDLDARIQLIIARRSLGEAKPDVSLTIRKANEDEAHMFEVHRYVSGSGMAVTRLPGFHELQEYLMGYMVVAVISNKDHISIKWGD